MLFKFVEMLMRPRRLREAIEAVVHENDQILRALKEYEKNDKPTNLSWNEGGLWKGWKFNEEDGKYYFDDYGTESITDLIDSWDRVKNLYDDINIGGYWYTNQKLS
jgi:hypothetical protein